MTRREVGSTIARLRAWVREVRVLCNGFGGCDVVLDDLEALRQHDEAQAAEVAHAQGCWEAQCDENTEARERIAVLEKALEWRDIESAPRDGSPVLWCSVGPWPYDYSPGLHPTTVRFRTYHPNSPGKKVWRDQWGRPVSPTFWVPLHVLDDLEDLRQHDEAQAAETKRLQTRIEHLREKLTIAEAERDQANEFKTNREADLLLAQCEIEHLRAILQQIADGEFHGQTAQSIAQLGLAGGRGVMPSSQTTGGAR